MATSNLFNKYTFQWIPGHYDIEGNEKANAVAKEGAQKQQQNCALEFKTATAAVKKEMKKKWINIVGERNTHYNNATRFTPPNWKKYDNIDRKCESILSPLRTGKSPLTMGYLQKIKPEKSNK